MNPLKLFRQRKKPRIFSFDKNGFRLCADDYRVHINGHPAPFTIVIEQGKITGEGREDEK